MDDDIDPSTKQYVDLLYWLRWSLAAYKKKVDEDSELRIALGLNDDDEVLVHSVENQLFLQPYYVVDDKKNKRMVLGIRGTLSFKDVLTDVIAAPKSILDGRFAHSGMYESAKNLLDQKIVINQSESQKLDLRSYLEEKLRNSSEEYKLVITGHSLGAGVAALTTFLLKSERGYLAEKVSCWAFACPPVLDLTSATEAKEYINSVVDRDDIVPRLSLLSVLVFLSKFPLESLFGLETSMKLGENEFTEGDETPDEFAQIVKSSLESLKDCEDEVIASGIEDYFSSDGNETPSSRISFFLNNLIDYLKERSLYIPGMLHHAINVEGDDPPPVALEHSTVSHWMTVLETPEAPLKAYDKRPFLIDRGTSQENFIDIVKSENMVTDHYGGVHGNAIFQALKHFLNS